MVSISRGSSFLKIITISLIVIYFASLVRGTTGFRATQPRDDPSKDSFGTAFLNRTSFPAGFVFGTGSSAYQFEGAANESGRAPSIWDTFVHKYPGKVTDGSNGDVAVDSYHRYKEDVGIMKEMGMDAYRFSISWSRILPKGKISGGVNKEGIEYYNNLINELHANGIKPFVTLFHWDLPQAMEDEHGGFLTHHVVKHFEAYAELCYKEFGDRVKHWITFNEPIALAVAGYDLGVLAPGRCSTWISPNCTGGNSTTEPYLVSHYQLLAHAAAANSYKNHYQKSQKGEIGITLAAEWLVPNNTEAQQDKAAQLRALDFTLGWYMDPLTTGDYPKSMRSLVGDRLPKFKKEQSKLLKGSFDFIGFNYYTSTYVSDAPELKFVVNQSFVTDYLATMSPLRNGVPIGPEAATEGLYIYPSGIRDILLYTKKKYNNPIIYITENGVDEFNDPKLTLQEALADDQRIDYHFRHLYYLRASIKDGVNVKGYFAWSLLDNFEWTLGYTVRYGINYVDYKDGLKRYPKHSALWFKNFLKKYQHTDDGGTVRRPAPYGVAQL